LLCRTLNCPSRPPDWLLCCCLHVVL
jgi:hypothetical protein